MTPAQKTQLTKDIKQVKLYIHYMIDQCRTQPPQPNGIIYLYGEPITLVRLNDAIIEYNKLVKLRGIGGEYSLLTSLPHKYEN